ncbi:flagellar hook assembly protein FlgD [Roseibium aggregatum]|uniref:flagellar hook assembly protein FlgD n=1 Tax=Roseibium aggregatum TaxID=187304 RepID=UPI003A96D2E6
MSISTVNSYVVTSTESNSSSSSSSLDITSEDFLSLMVDQLQNQNPLDPSDTDSYIDKLISYASYDSQTEISEQLSTIVDSLSGTISSSGLGYIGQTVEASGNTTTLADGSAEWSYTLDGNAASVTINIVDENGNTVWSESGDTSAGKHSVTWDGTTSDGSQLEDGGLYTIEVAAVDGNGNQIDGETAVVGTVTGIDVSGNDTLLMIGNASVLLDNVQSIQA